MTPAVNPCFTLPAMSNNSLPHVGYLLPPHLVSVPARTSDRSPGGPARVQSRGVRAVRGHHALTRACHAPSGCCCHPQHDPGHPFIPAGDPARRARRRLDPICRRYRDEFGGDRPVPVRQRHAGLGSHPTCHAPVLPVPSDIPDSTAFVATLAPAPGAGPRGVGLPGIVDPRARAR